MDWQSLISDLKERGFRQEEIAALCKCKQSTVSDLARGITKRPNVELGLALLALHKSRRKPEAKAVA